MPFFILGIIIVLALVGLIFPFPKKTKPVAPPKPSKTCFSGELLTDPEWVCFLDGHCPDCTARLFEGPHGGMSVNYYCPNEACGSRFNFMGPFGVERISVASPKLIEPEGEQLPHTDNGPYRH